MVAVDELLEVNDDLSKLKDEVYAENEDKIEKASNALQYEFLFEETLDLIKELKYHKDNVKYNMNLTQKEVQFINSLIFELNTQIHINLTKFDSLDNDFIYDVLTDKINYKLLRHLYRSKFKKDDK